MSSPAIQTTKPTGDIIKRHLITNTAISIVLTVVLAYFIPGIGLMELANLIPILAMIFGAIMASLAISALAGNFFAIGFVGALVSMGSAALVYILMHEQAGMIILVFGLATFIANIISKYAHTPKEQSS